MTQASPLSLLRRTWWLTALVVAIALVVATILTRRATPVYRSTATVVVVPNGAVVTTPRDVIDSLDTLDRRSVVATLARVAYSQPIVREAAERAGLPPEAARRCRVRSIVLPNTNIVDIDVTGPEPEACARLANAVADRASSEAMLLYQPFRMRLLDEATPGRRPISPDLRRNLIVAGALGALAGLLVALGAGLVVGRGASPTSTSRSAA
jgi:capsular polysaccharide biosynthesis protein